MKKALITGGNRGIGLETAAQLAKLGYQVVIGSRSKKNGEEALEHLKERGFNTVTMVELDVESEESVKAAAAEVGKKFEYVLDVLINNAGYFASPTSLESGVVDVDAVKKSMEINLYGAMRVTNHFIEMIKLSPAGRIVNVSSDMGSIQLGSLSLSTAGYNTSKIALNMYTVALADSLKGTSIKVNAAHPGWVRTDMGGSGAPLGLLEGTETIIYLATLPKAGPTGGYFFKKDPLPW